MKYVLQSEDNAYNADDLYVHWYIHPNEKVGYQISKAKVFNSRKEAKAFSKRPVWKSSYVVISITEKDLFKARLSNK